MDTFTWGRVVLSLPKRAHVDWNWPILREKYLKLDSMICYNAVALAYYGSCRFPVMDTWNYLNTFNFSYERLQRKNKLDDSYLLLSNCDKHEDATFCKV